MPDPIDTVSIRRRLASGEIRNPTEVLFAALKEVDRLRAELSEAEPPLTEAEISAGVVERSERIDAAITRLRRACIPGFDLGNQHKLDVLALLTEGDSLRVVADAAAEVKRLRGGSGTIHVGQAWDSLGDALDALAALEADR